MFVTNRPICQPNPIELTETQIKTSDWKVSKLGTTFTAVAGSQGELLGKPGKAEIKAVAAKAILDALNLGHVTPEITMGTLPAGITCSQCFNEEGEEIAHTLLVSANGTAYVINEEALEDYEIFTEKQFNQELKPDDARIHFKLENGEHLLIDTDDLLEVQQDKEGIYFAQDGIKYHLIDSEDGSTLTDFPKENDLDAEYSLETVSPQKKAASYQRMLDNIIGRRSDDKTGLSWDMNLDPDEAKASIRSKKRRKFKNFEIDDNQYISSKICTATLIDCFLASIILRTQDGKLMSIAEGNILFQERDNYLVPHLIDLTECLPPTTNELVDIKSGHPDGTHTLRLGLMGLKASEKTLSKQELTYLETTCANIQKLANDQLLSNESVTNLYTPYNEPYDSNFSTPHVASCAKICEKLNKAVTDSKSLFKKNPTLQNLVFSAFPKYKEQWDQLKDVSSGNHNIAWNVGFLSTSQRQMLANRGRTC